MSTYEAELHLAEARRQQHLLHWCCIAMTLRCDDMAIANELLAEAKIALAKSRIYLKYMDKIIKVAGRQDKWTREYRRTE